MEPNIKHHVVGFATLVSLLGGCAKKQDLAPDCTNACTIITGRFTTDNRTIGLANVPLDLKWVDFTGLTQVANRRKATTTTDANGNYTFRFYRNDDELTDGLYSVHYQADANTYIVNRDGQGAEIDAGNLKRDTIIVSDWLLPRKAYLHLNVTNPMPISEYFVAEYSFENGARSGPNRFNATLHYGLYSFSGTPATSADVVIGANQPVELAVDKTKNGVRTIQRDTIRLAAGAHYSHQVTY